MQILLDNGVTMIYTKVVPWYILWYNIKGAVNNPHRLTVYTIGRLVMATKRFDNLEPERRDAILAIARREFIAHGYEKASLNTIIADAGISKGSLYYYFEDKADLFMTVFADMYHGLTREVQDGGLGEFTDDFWGDVTAYSATAIRMVFGNPDMVQMAREFVHMLSSPMLPQSFKPWYDEMRSQIRVVIRRGQELGEVRNDLPEDLLILLAYSTGQELDCWVFDTYTDPDDDTIYGLVAIYIDLWKRMLGSEKALRERRQVS